LNPAGLFFGAIFKEGAIPGKDGNFKKLKDYKLITIIVKK
jgi:hypothetical protein